MAKSTKEMSKLDFEQVLKSSYTDEIASASTTGFVQGKIGHRVEAVDVSPTTLNISYYDSGTLLMTLQIIYTDASQTKFVSAERIA